jgi:uncharacterized protein
MIDPNAWIQTFTGKQFFPLDPDPADIDIVDIAHALSNICRFTGHCREFYSVAEHSIRVSRIVPEKDALWGLLHDASEAYICDVARPLKRWPEFEAVYRPIEDRLMRAVCERFGLPVEMPASVREADLVLLHTEARDLMGKPPQDWHFEARALDWNIVPLSSRLARADFLEHFNQLTADEAPGEGKGCQI